MKNNEVVMTEGNFYKKILFYAIPLFLTGALQLFYNAADLIVCGIFGSPNATAAISSTNSLSGFLVQFSIGLSLGANAVMAKAYGANDKVKGQKIVYTSMVVSIVFGIILSMIGIAFCDEILVLMKADPEVIVDSTLYLKLFFVSLPFSMIYNFGASIFRAIGDSKRPFIFLAISGGANIVLNVLFVVVFKLDVAGVAIATIISQLLAATLIVIALFRYHGFFHFNIKELRISKEEFLEVMVVGLPAGIQNSIFSISNMVLQSSVNSLGLAVISGYGASSSIEGFGLTAMNSFGQAAMVFIAANMGAKRIDNVKKIIWICIMYIVLSNVLIGGLLLPFSKPLLSLYVSRQAEPLRSESIHQGQIKLFTIVLTQFLCGIMHLFAFSMRGLGKSTTPMLSTLISICGFRLFWIYVMFNNTPELQSIFGIAVSYPISWVFTASINLIFLIIFYKKAYFNYNKECEELLLDAETQK